MFLYVKEHQDKVRQREQEPGTPKIFGLKLTVEQYEAMKKEGFVFLENMTNSKGQLFSGYVKYHRLICEKKLYLCPKSRGKTTTQR